MNLPLVLFKNKAHNLQKRKMIVFSGLKRIFDLVINLHTNFDLSTIVNKCLSS